MPADAPIVFHPIGAAERQIDDSGLPGRLRIAAQRRKSLRFRRPADGRLRPRGGAPRDGAPQSITEGRAMTFYWIYDLPNWVLGVPDRRDLRRPVARRAVRDPPDGAEDARTRDALQRPGQLFLRGHRRVLRPGAGSHRRRHLGELHRHRRRGRHRGRGGRQLLPRPGRLSAAAPRPPGGDDARLRQGRHRKGVARPQERDRPGRRGRATRYPRGRGDELRAGQGAGEDPARARSCDRSTRSRNNAGSGSRPSPPVCRRRSGRSSSSAPC